MENVVLIQIALEAWGAFWTFICGVAAYLGRQDEPHRSKLLTNLLFTDTLLLINEQLCKTQPTKAASATHQFAKYLRSNLNAMASPEQISFREELEHIRAYVWLENMRFGEDLCFREEIQVDSFTIPALSVQPLVENSIKHGMMGKEEGNIHVVLSTWEENDAFYVRVSDDGCGFDPHEKPKDTNIHIGLFNLKERIRIMCGGTVEVTSKPNQGTTVTIQIPK